MQVSLVQQCFINFRQMLAKGTAYGSLFLSMTIWGISWVVLDDILIYLPVDQVILIRLIIAGLIFGIIYIVRGIKMKIQKEDFLLVMLSGFIGVAGYHYFESWGLLLIGRDMVQVIIGTLPIIILAIAILFMKKRTKIKNTLWIVVAFIGMVLVTNTNIKIQTSELGGIGLMLLAIVCWALYGLANERLLAKYDELNLLGTQVFYAICLAGSIYYFKYISGISEEWKWDIIRTNQIVVLELLFLSIMGLVIFYYFYNKGIKSIGAILSSIFIYLIPVVILLVMVALEQTKLTLITLIGSMLIVISIYKIEDI